MFSALAQCLGQGTAEEIERLQKDILSTLRSTPSLGSSPGLQADNTVLTQQAPDLDVTQKAPGLDVTQKAPNHGTALQWQVALSSQQSPPALPSSPSSSTEGWIGIAKPFLQLHVTGRNKVNAILQVLKSFSTPSEILSPEEFWSEQDGILDGYRGSHHFKRVSRCLQESRIRTATSKYHERLFSLFYSHDIDELVRSPQVLEHRGQQGKSRLTSAFEMMAAIAETTPDAVATEYRAGKKYKKLVAMGGPGSILQLDSRHESK